MPKTNVLVTWEIESELKKYLSNRFIKNKNVNFIFPRSFSQKNLMKHSRDAHVMVGWRASPELLTSSKKLFLYINPGTGIKHHINNFREISKIQNVILVNGHGHAYYTAQHVVAMLLSFMSRIIPHHNWMQNGIWRTSDDKDVFSASIPLRKRKVGLLGYGAINKYVHKFLSGFEIEFHLLKRKWDDDRKSIIELGDQLIEKTLLESDENSSVKIYKYEEKDLNKFLKAIDILVIAVPHTSKTENLITLNELKLLGKEGILVNVARGTIVKEADLYKALKQKIISGAALDVWYNYNPKKDKSGKMYPYKFPFHNLKNILLSPHRAASPFNDIGRWDEVIVNIERAASGRKDFLNIVDLKQEY